MKNCLLCGQETSGSIGAAGMYWRSLCQTCKNSEDAALTLRINAEAQGLKFIMEKLFGLGEPGSGDCALQTRGDSAVPTQIREALPVKEKLEQFKEVL